jgi:hypothetical protein
MPRSFHEGVYVKRDDTGRRFAFRNIVLGGSGEALYGLVLFNEFKGVKTAVRVFGFKPFSFSRFE